MIVAAASIVPATCSVELTGGRDRDDRRVVLTAVTVTLMTSLSLVAAPVPVATMPPNVSVALSVIVAGPL